MCRNNPIGTADLMVALHHGLPISNSEVLVHAVRPRAVIVDNAIRKGANPEAMRTYFTSPGIEDVWQNHFSLRFGRCKNSVRQIFNASSRAARWLELPATW
jgi:competence protein ComEC